MEIYVLRNLVMRYGSQVGLHPNQKEFLWHILDFDHNGKKISWPSLKTIGARMSMTDAGARKIAKSLVRKRLIRIGRVKGKSNRYNYENTIAKFKPFWEAEAKKGSFLDTENIEVSAEEQKTDPCTKVQDTPAQKFRTPLHKSSGHPCTKVQPNTVSNTVNNSISKTDEKFPRSSDSKLPLKKYAVEWAMWTAEQGDELFERAFGDKRVWDAADLQGFANLRDGGKNIHEITERFKIYLAEENSWYATKGYSFAEFAKNYNTFSPVIAARKGKQNGSAGYFDRSPNDAQAIESLRQLGITIEA